MSIARALLMQDSGEQGQERQQRRRNGGRYEEVHSMSNEISLQGIGVESQVSAKPWSRIYLNVVTSIPIVMINTRSLPLACICCQGVPTRREGLRSGRVRYIQCIFRCHICSSLLRKISTHTTTGRRLLFCW